LNNKLQHHQQGCRSQVGRQNIQDNIAAEIEVEVDAGVEAAAGSVSGSGTRAGSIMGKMSGPAAADTAGSAEAGSHPAEEAGVGIGRAGASSLAGELSIGSKVAIVQNCIAAGLHCSPGSSLLSGACGLQVQLIAVVVVVVGVMLAVSWVAAGKAMLSPVALWCLWHSVCLQMIAGSCLGPEVAGEGAD
jgi:hypothetical protein